jgi:hypothetical protein
MARARSKPIIKETKVKWLKPKVAAIDASWGAGTLFEAVLILSCLLRPARLPLSLDAVPKLKFWNSVSQQPPLKTTA